MAAIAAQYINVTPVIVYALLLYLVVPFGACVLAGLIGTSDRKGFARGSLCGVLTVMASAAGCSVVMETSDNNISAFVIQALATAGVGAALTFWAVGLKFWNN